MLAIFLGMVLNLGNTVADYSFNLSVPHGPIPVQLGSSATLPCQLNPRHNAVAFRVEWNRLDKDSTVVLLRENRQIQGASVAPEYRDRASLIGDLEKGNVSLKLENITLADRGEYVCFVKHTTWYERASVSLSMKVVGSVPVLSYTEVGKDEMNVTCVSDGWSSQPTLTWKYKQGREIDNNPVYEYSIDADGLVSVDSWLLVSPSKSEWISCSVYLSDQEMRESRVMPQITRTQTDAVTLASSSGEWRAAFITILVLVLLEFSILFLFHRKGLDLKSTHRLLLGISILENRQKKGSHDERPECIAEEITPLQYPTEQKVQTAEKAVTDNSTMTDAQIIKITELDMVKGNAVKLTLDATIAPTFLTIAKNGKSVTCSDPKKQAPQGDHHPHVLCNERLSSHQHYWEITGYSGVMGIASQHLYNRQFWYAGVCSAAAAVSKVKSPVSPEHGFWVLHYRKGTGYFANTEPTTHIPVAKEFNTLGVYLDCDKHTLSFYDAQNKQHLCTFYNIPPLKILVPLICPGVKDKDCIQIS
ncbi:butyrophilin subfamily 1 member A1-like isoform X2 [Alosa sapidissima]|uniref:butyrophilin subfamily 1 member A1-like isoform X2 n=1 Tax=Alosa sapidissima TaxID=34773 RepID=UPI001C08E699|nr:butyrophilin subfamily 1 member A1-like isoform X2 [Alosa sapidissima]